MLKIRADQMVAFENAQEQRFIGEFLVFLEAFGLENGIPTSHVGERHVRAGIARATQCGLSTRDQLTAFLLVSTLVSEEFSDFPCVEKILKDRARLPDHRLETVLIGLDAEDWQIVAAHQKT